MDVPWPGPLVLFPASLGQRFADWGESWGTLDARYDDPEGLVTISGFSNKGTYRLPYTAAWTTEHVTRYADIHRNLGLWYRCDPDLHDLHKSLLIRRLAVHPDAIRQLVKAGWQEPSVDSLTLVVTYSRDDAASHWSAWWVSRDEARPALLSIVEDERDAWDFIKEQWPVDELVDTLVTIVGCGSIGSAAAEALASYGIGQIALVDPDRLMQRNLVRHRAPSKHLGRFKVHAVADTLMDRYPNMRTEHFPLSIIEDADVMRPLFARSDVVLCATDGIASRRTANHLARRANTPIVLACVLEDGAFGEIVRVRPRAGCLLCLRNSLVESGTLDPEPGLDLEYGTGSPHRPMTAAAGDLHFVGQLAAKSVVATVLEAKGRWNQRLAGDWALIGLQPQPDMPPPFDLERAGDVRWLPLPNARPDCPTCTAA